MKPYYNPKQFPSNQDWLVWGCQLFVLSFFVAIILASVLVGFVVVVKSLIGG